MLVKSPTLEKVVLVLLMKIGLGEIIFEEWGVKYIFFRTIIYFWYENVLGIMNHFLKLFLLIFLFQLYWYYLFGGRRVFSLKVY